MEVPLIPFKRALMILAQDFKILRYTVSEFGLKVVLKIITFT